MTCNTCGLPHDQHFIEGSDRWCGCGYASERQRQPTPQTFAYLVHCAESGLTKIGKSDDPEKRLASLQTGSPTELSLVCVLRDEVGDMESQLHNEFRNRRVRGEWFRLLRREIADVQKRPSTTFVGSIPRKSRANADPMVALLCGDCDHSARWDMPGAVTCAGFDVCTHPSKGERRLPSRDHVSEGLPPPPWCPRRGER